MTTTTARPEQPPVLRAHGWRGRVELRYVITALIVAINGVAFVIVQPGVNDLWAARARASAASHGVGLTYWFSWFGGGATPGNYSIVTPYLCAAIGTELVGALAALAALVIVAFLVRGTRYPFPATVAAAIGLLTNLWSGRIPFLLCSAIALGAVLALQHGKRSLTVALTLLSVLASPVAGAFLALGLSGTFLTTRTKAYRPIIAYAVLAAMFALLAVAVLFGAPGPEPFDGWLAFEVGCGLVFLWVSWPDDHVRTTLWVSVIALLGVAVIPNGLGSNYTRFVFSCLPVLVLATSNRRLRLAAFGVTPVLVMSVIATSLDLVNAAQPVSSVGYYKGLAAELDKIPQLRNYRLEVVNHGAHAGDDALVEHAMLARGWETQEDTALNDSLLQNPLSPVTYKVWLDDNAVGYVALPSAQVQSYPEYRLVKDHTPSYLHRIWRSQDWQLYAVDNPTPIVASPATVLGHDQKSMTITVPCACTIGVRVRWSKFLDAVLQRGAPVHGKTVDARPTQQAKVFDDGTGWTLITTPRAGTYMLRGSLSGLLR